MKRILLVSSFVLFGTGVGAQSFTMQHDTVEALVPTFDNLFNEITCIASDSIVVDWRVIDSDFPADWSTANALGICDNYLCRTNYNNQLLDGTSYSSGKYPPGEPGDFHLQVYLTSSSTGTHYLRVELREGTNQTDTITFIVHHFATSASIIADDDQLVVYPNPTNGLILVNLEDLESIALYDTQGRKVKEGRMNVIDARDLPDGVYLIDTWKEQRKYRSKVVVAH
jgi:hypothetical protein